MAFGLPQNNTTAPAKPDYIRDGGYGTNTGNVFMNKGWKDNVKGMGLDPNGNNEIGQMFKRGGFGLAPDFFNRIGFMNEIGPQRIQAIRDMLAKFAPGNLQANAEQNRARLLRQGSQSALLARSKVAGMGGSADAQAGAALARENQASAAANDYQNNLYSPEAQAAISKMLMEAFGQSENLNLQNLMPMFGAVEQRYAQNQADQQQGGLGGFLGQLGGFAGMLPSFGGGGGTNMNWLSKGRF